MTDPTDPTNPGTPSLLRVLNDRNALALLLDNGPLSKNELARLSGLSKPTAAEMVRRLEEAELIVTDGEQSGRRGPAATTYAVRGDRELGVAIDVTPTAITATVVDVMGSPAPVIREPIDPTGEQRPAIEALQDAIERACAAAHKDPLTVTAISVGIQAAVDPNTDDLVFTDKMPGWPRHRVGEQLADGLGVRVTLNNDANLAAIAERAGGGAADATVFALLWIAEGLGVAVDIDGRIHQGATGGAGEVGYLAPPLGASDQDPAAALIEDLLSMQSLLRLCASHGFSASTYAEALAVLRGLGGDGDLDGLLDDLATRVCFAVQPVVAVLDPELIVIAGPTGSAGGAALASRVEAWMRTHSRWSPRIAVSKSPESTVLLGASQVLLMSLRQSLFDSVSMLR